MNTDFIVGSNATVTCRSDTFATQIDWLDEGQVVRNVTDQKNLNLKFHPVRDTDHGKVYICQVTRLGQLNVVIQNFTLEAKGS